MIVFVATIVVFIILLFRKKKVEAVKEVQKPEEAVDSVGQQKIDIYKILGIPVQYKEDGSIIIPIV